MSKTKAKDREAVRQLLQTEQDGWHEGDAEKVLSCYAEDVVQYGAAGGRLHLATVHSIGHEGLRQEQVANVEAAAKHWKAHPDEAPTFEVLHVDVKDKQALALTQHGFTRQDETSKETIHSLHQSLWMLAKNGGEWKVTHVLGATAHEQIVTRSLHS